MSGTFEFTIPADPNFALAGGALGVVAGAYVIGALVSAAAGARLSALWHEHAGHAPGQIGDRVPFIVRHGTAALLLGLAVALYPEAPLARLVLGLGLAVAGAFAVYHVVRGVIAARWIALAAAAVAFSAAVAGTVRERERIASVLDQVGFAVGGTRFSLLDLLNIAVALTILFVVFRLASRVIDRSVHRSRRLDGTQQLLVSKLAGIALLAAAFLVGIDIVGIDLTALAVFSGAFGLAIGFGLQKTFGNLIAGIILLWDRSIKPGDVIVVGDSFGKISKIGVRAVSVVTRDGKEHLIPNENLMTQEVENWSYSSRDVRIHIPVGIAYDCDIELAQRLMAEAAMAAPRVLPEPEPVVWLTAFGESSVDHEILVWIQDPEAGVGNVQSEVLNRVWRAFKAHGIGIPYPTRDINIRTVPGPEAG